MEETHELFELAPLPTAGTRFVVTHATTDARWFWLFCAFGSNCRLYTARQIDRTIFSATFVKSWDNGFGCWGYICVEKVLLSLHFLWRYAAISTPEKGRLCFAASYFSFLNGTGRTVFWSFRPHNPFVKTNYNVIRWYKLFKIPRFNTSKHIDTNPTQQVTPHTCKTRPSTKRAAPHKR